MHCRLILLLVGASLSMAALPSDAAGQNRFNDPRRESLFAIEATLGYSFLTGAIGDSVSGGLGGELLLAHQIVSIPLRLGIGGGYHRLAFDDEDQSLGKLSLFGFLTYLLYSDESEMTPYVQGRAGWTRLSWTEARGTGRDVSRSGLEIGAAVGVDIPVAERVSIDVVGLFTWISAGDREADGDTLPSTDETGSTFGIRAGVIFFTN